jgi:hypothetical protein
VFTATACFTDKDGGLGCSSRTIEVLSAAEAAQLLEDTILALKLSGGTEASLTSALDVASAAFDAGRTTPGVKLVESFIIRVEAAAGSRIDAEDAEVLIYLANRIIDSATS